MKFYYEPEFSQEVIFAEGLDYYVFHDNSGRNWGDYTTSVVDPSNQRDFWTFGQYASNHLSGVVYTNSGRHALRWANIPLHAPTNDIFASSTTISGSAGSTNVLIQRTTREASEPAHHSTNYTSIWYIWTAPGAGQVRFSIGTNNQATPLLPGALSVYTGASIGGLTSVAQSSPPTPIDVTPRGAPFVSFDASSNVTYRVAVIVNAAEFRKFTLHWSQPTAPIILAPIVATVEEVVHGYSRTFQGAAAGHPAPTFQWRLNGNPISGATSSNYVISSMSSSLDGLYTLVASNTHGSATSEAIDVIYFAKGAYPLDLGTFTNAVYELTLQHVTGYEYIVHGSTNLIDWFPIKTNVVPFTFSDTNTVDFAYKFYKSEFVP